MALALGSGASDPGGRGALLPCGAACVRSPRGVCTCQGCAVPGSSRCCNGGGGGVVPHGLPQGPEEPTTSPALVPLCSPGTEELLTYGDCVPLPVPACGRPPVLLTPGLGTASLAVPPAAASLVANVLVCSGGRALPLVFLKKDSEPDLGGWFLLERLG